MNVCFLMIAFPDVVENPNQYTDLALEFAARGHKVTVVTAQERRFKDKTRLRTESSLQVLRVRSGNLFNVGFIQKGISTVSLPWLYRRAIEKYLPETRFDLVLFATPPITLRPVVRFLKKRDGCRTYLILRDIFPQNAKDLGLMNNAPLFNHFRRTERELYRLSDEIGCMSQGNIRYLLEHNDVPAEHCHLLPNWRKIREEKEMGAPTVDYRRAWGLNGKFVALFGGVIGLAQELEYLLELARSYRERKDIVFLIVGEGNQKARLCEAVAREGLSQVVIKDRIPSRDFWWLVRQCDLGLINLDRRFTIPNIPSKTLDYFEAGIPVLAAIDARTDYGRLLEESGGGLWSVTGDLPAYRRNFETLLENPGLRQEMGRRGRAYLAAHWTLEKAFETIIARFEEAAQT